MTRKSNIWYDPALRMKAGELEGISALAPDIADRTLPRMIVPPPEERDEALQRCLIESEALPDVSGPLSAAWPMRDILVEPTHIFDEFDRSRSGVWLPKMFERAWNSNVRGIPLANSTDLLADKQGAFKHAADHDADVKLGIVLSSGDLADSEVLNRVMDALGSSNLDPADCLVTADFHDADFTQPEYVVGVIEGILDMLKGSALWKQIVFQGTNYPDHNPADAGGSYLVPRNEWIAWRRAVNFDPQTAEHMIFGDYAADCAKLKFGKSGGRAIPHYRYATDNAWHVYRGSDRGTHEEAMRGLCRNILKSLEFAGRDFCSADNQIFLCANGAIGPGNARNWRGINTTHHITRVVTDIGAIRGVTFAKKSFGNLSEQVDMFAQ